MENNEEGTLVGQDLDSSTSPWEHDNACIRLPAQFVRFLWHICIRISSALVEFLSKYIYPILFTLLRISSALVEFLSKYIYPILFTLLRISSALVEFLSKYIYPILFTLLIVLLFPLLIYLSRGEFPLGLLILCSGIAILLAILEKIHQDR